MRDPAAPDRLRAAARAALCLLLASGLAAAEPKVVFVDGREVAGVIVTADGTTALVQGADGSREEVAVKSLVLAVGADPKKAPLAGSPFNLYLHGGDRLRGAVTGDGEVVRLDSPSVLGLRVPLDGVSAVRFGRLLGARQASYGEVFDKELARGRDAIVIQRDTRPFPIYARVLAVGEAAITARVEDAKRELDLARVYGFVRTADADRAAPAGVRVRAYLAGGERITLPLEKITAEAVEGGGVRVLRDQVERIEFLGDHIAHLSDFDPIAVVQKALLGQPPPYRRDGMALGGPLRIAGRSYERGVGVLSYTKLEYVLGGRWETFFARCGIDDTAGAEGDAVFRVLGDGKVLKEVRRRRGEPPETVRVDVTGIDRLVLEALPGDSYISDFCDWAEARVFNARPLPSGGK